MKLVLIPSQTQELSKTTRAASDKPKSPDFWQMLLAFFRRLSNGPSDQEAPINPDDNSNRASQRSPTSIYVTFSPTTGSPPVTPCEPGRGWSYLSPIEEELMQSLDLSCQITLTSPLPIFEGTYSDIYKGSYRGEEVSGFLLCGL